MEHSLTEFSEQLVRFETSDAISGNTLKDKHSGKTPDDKKKRKATEEPVPQEKQPAAKKKKAFWKVLVALLLLLIQKVVNKKHFNFFLTYNQQFFDSLEHFSCTMINIGQASRTQIKCFQMHATISVCSSLTMCHTAARVGL